MSQAVKTKAAEKAKKAAEEVRAMACRSCEADAMRMVDADLEYCMSLQCFQTAHAKRHP